MNIVVKFKDERGVYGLSSMIFGSDEDKSVLTWTNSTTEPGAFYGFGISMNGKEMSGKDLSSVMHKKLTGLFSVLGIELLVEIESLTFSDTSGSYYYVPKELLSRFRKHEIHEEKDGVGVDLNLTEEEYELVANHVRRTDKLQNIQNCIDLHLDDLGFENVKAFLEKKLQEEPDELLELYTDYVDGKGEIECLENILSRYGDYGGMARYQLISHLGTEEEQVDEVILVKQEAEHLMEDIRERENGADMLLKEGELILYDVWDEPIDMFYVDKIEFIDEKYL